MFPKKFPSDWSCFQKSLAVDAKRNSRYVLRKSLFSKIRIIISHLVQGPTRIFLGTKMDTKMFYSFTSNRTWHCWFLRLVNDLFEFSLTLFLQEGCSIRMLSPQTYSKNVWYFAARLQEYFGCFVGSNV